jgi:tape measure domain-containing protein
MADKVTVVVEAILKNEKFKKALEDSKNKAEKSTKGIASGISKLKTAYFAVAAVITGTVAKAFISLISLTSRAEAQQKALNTVFGKRAPEAMKFVREEAKRLGLEIEQATGSFTKIAAAAKGTIIEGQGVREVFSGVSEAARALGLNTEQTNGALKALEQIISKGKVQAEELRGQLGERIPGAFQIAARAMDMTTQELDKFMSDGKLAADVFIPRFAKQLREEFGGAAEDASKSFQAASARLRNSFRDIALSLGEKILPKVTSLFTLITTGIEKVKEFEKKFGIGFRVVKVAVFTVKLGISSLAVTFFKFVFDAIRSVKLLGKSFLSLGTLIKNVLSGKGLKASVKEFFDTTIDNAIKFGKDFIKPYKKIKDDTLKLIEDLKNGNKDLSKNQKDTTDEITEDSKKRTKAVVLTAKDRMKLMKFLGEDEKNTVEAVLKDQIELIQKFADKEVEIRQAASMKIREIKAKEAADLITKINDLQNQISDITQSFFDAEIEKNQNKSNREISALEEQHANELISDEEFESKKEEIEKKARIDEAKLQRKAAVASRIGALFDIAANTSIAVAKSIAASPLTLGQPWAGINTGIGIAQAAAVLAKPLPEVPAFAGGVRNFSGGPAMINEKGGELVNLPSGANVLTNAATKDLLFGGGSRSTVSNSTSTVNNDNSQRNFTFNGIRDVGAARNQLMRTEGRRSFQ